MLGMRLAERKKRQWPGKKPKDRHIWGGSRTRWGGKRGLAGKRVIHMGKIWGGQSIG